MAKQHKARPLCRVSVTCNISSGPSGRQGIDVFVPDAVPAGRPLLVMVPGSWWHGERDALRGHALLLAQEGWPVAITGHRLFDEVPNGQPMRKDIEEGTLKAIEECGIHGYECTSVIMIGTGSGCLLAQLAADDMSSSGSAAIAGCVLVGATPQRPWSGCPERWEKQLQRFSASLRELDIIAMAGPEQPPVLGLVAKDDPDLPAAAANSWCDELRQAGYNIERHEFKKGSHDLLGEAIGPASNEIVDRILLWADEQGKQHHGLPVIGDLDIERRRARELAKD